MWEYVQDWYWSTYNIKDKIDPKGPSSNKNVSMKVSRGGSWPGPYHWQRSSSRHADYPNIKAAGCIGFRLVWEKD